MRTKTTFVKHLQVANNYKTNFLIVKSKLYLTAQIILLFWNMVKLPFCSLFAHFRCRPALSIEATPVAIICPHLYWWRHSVVKWGPTLTLEILELGCWKAIGGSWGLGKSWIRLLMLNIWAAIPINLMQEQTFKFAFHVDSDTLSSPELTRSVEDEEQKLNKFDQWHSQAL